MLGYEINEFPQTEQAWVDIVHPEDMRQTIDSIYRQLREGDTFSIEYRIRTKQGEYRWVIGKGSVISRDNEGKVERIVGTNIDVTEQKEMLDALLEGERKYRNLYNNALVGMVTNRYSDGKIIAINERGRLLRGYSGTDEALETMSIVEHFVNEQERRVMVKELMTMGEIKNHEIQLTRKDGSAFWAMVSVKLYKGEDKIDSTFVDISRRKKAEEQLHNLMFYDQLTRLPNKEMFINRLTIEIVRAQRRSKMFALICLGLDNFKKINDMHGPKVGDRVLTMLGSSLQRTLRDDDMVSRFVGDQFMILLSDIRTADDVVDVVKKIFTVISEPMPMEDAVIKLTASMGITIYPHDGDSGDIMIKNSESAMFMAKESGKNNYVMFDHKMHDQVLKHFTIEEELHNAIANDEFTAYYQPKVNKDGGIFGMETLIRWNSKKLGIVSPMEFIPIAERTGLIIDIGYIMLKKACRQNKSWQDMGMPGFTVSVNLSPYQFRSPNLIEQIGTVLQETGLDAQWLELEITESGIIEHERESVERLNNIHAMGIAISIDDFGTGYSSLSKLKLYPIDTLKIDKSFVDDLPHDPMSVSITTTIISLAENLGFKVIAEGVETRDQVEFLISKNCTSFQGYHFYRPMPAGELEEILKG